MRPAAALPEGGARALFVNPALPLCQAPACPCSSRMPLSQSHRCHTSLSSFIATSTSLPCALRQDDDPYVRKTAAVCVAKLYDINPELVEDRGFLDLLKARAPLPRAGSSIE